MGISEDIFRQDFPHEPLRPPANTQSSRVTPHRKNALLWTHVDTLFGERESVVQISWTKRLLKHVQNMMVIYGDW